MKKITLLIALISFICIAEEEVTQTEPKEQEEKTYSSITQKRYSNYLGFAAGSTTGYGLSYRKWIRSSWGFQINLLPFYREEKYDEDDDNWDDEDRDSGFFDTGNLSFGFTYLKKILDGKYIRFLFYTGANLNTSYEKYDYYYTEDDTESLVHKSGKEIENKIGVGAGVGCEWYVWRLGFHCMAGLMGDVIIESKSFGIGPTIEAGIHFRFDSRRSKK